ncbi:hypothetical protein ACEPAI_6132 [Sanghuangporus weigelae]
MAPPDSTLYYIRTVRPSDAPALSRICLLTGDAGKSAEGLHSIPELIGLFYACPYVSLPHTGGFVLARRRPLDSPDNVTRGEQQQHSSEEDVLGYTLFAYDTRVFEEAAEGDWFPPLRARYPKPLGEAWETVYDRQLTDADKRYIKLLHSPDRALEACVAFSPAHLHIDILPEAQRQGWGRRLIESAVRYLRDEKGLSGAWLGMDPRNVDAARFYERIGFQSIERAPSNYMSLMFENWMMN